jgi:signal transduction histidine kinase
VLPRRARLFSALAFTAVAVVNAAGLWSIAGAQQDASEEASRSLRLEAEARARALEARLAATRSDLAFLAGSPSLTQLIDGGGRGADGLRREAEAALLLFLRAHEEVTRLAVNGPGGKPLVLAGRRGGVPVLWVAASPTGAEGPAVAPGRVRVATVVPLGGAEHGPGLEAEVQASVLSDGCKLWDASRRRLAGEDRAEKGELLAGSATLAADGWSAPSPWRLVCERRRDSAVAIAQPVAARYRTTVALNLGAMALAALLGLLAVREVSKRERLEAHAREEARVRDLERQLFHAERLTSVGRLAAGIAHEINNPLEGMANYLSLAREALARGDTEAALRRLDGVRQGLERAALIVRQVLSHADPSKEPPRPVDLTSLLAETTEFVRSRQEFARIRFETRFAEAPLLVDGSPVMLGQVALNLIVNACEAQPAGGEVVVSAAREASQARVEVADRGPGIGPADRARIFEPFFSTKSSTGLGLSICHSIVERHGGRLEALAREGGGAVLRMTLPAGTSRPEAA